jgi:hypothetical protein
VGDRTPNWVRVGLTRRRHRPEPPERREWLVESFELPDPGTPRPEARRPRELLHGAAGVWDEPELPGPDLG